MRASFLAIVLTLAATPALAGPIRASEASAHIGQTATVEGVVSEVFTSRRGDTFIDIGGRYPNETFTGVIFRDDASAFGGVSGLAGKAVDLIGRIKTYRGRVEIVLRSRDQIKVK